MKRIPLTQGMFASVDDADFEWLSQWSWFAHRKSNGRIFYAERTDRVGRQKTIRMHRLILGAEVGQLADHRDGDGLNNQRANLRIATAAENARNVRPKRGRQFKGVRRLWGRWQARIQADRRMVYLGCYDTEEEAVRAYNLAAPVYHGQFARLNEVQNGNA